MPRVALINATAEPTRSRGSSSRRMLMPTGISAAANPAASGRISNDEAARAERGHQGSDGHHRMQTSIISRLP